MDIVQLLMGLVMLCAGRTFFWIFVGAVGFLAGFDLGTAFVTYQPAWVVLAIAISCGVFGVFAAWMFQSVAVTLAGALAGGMIAINLIAMLMPDMLINGYWMVYGCGAVAGAFLVFISFNWAIVFISSLMGAYLLVSNLPFEGSMQQIMMVGAVFVGVSIQAMQMSFIQTDHSH